MLGELFFKKTEGLNIFYIWKFGSFFSIGILERLLAKVLYHPAEK